MKKFLLWAPRILIIGYIVFISLFALDVFDSGLNFWQTSPALLIHLLPSFVLTVILILVWKRQLIGTTLLVVVTFIAFFFAKDSLLSKLILVGPLLLVCFLLLLGHPPTKK